MTETGSFWLKDMIVLGQGAPNQISKIGGQQGRCLCLWSDKTGFVRVYPVPHGYVHDWEVINAEVRKPTNDGRENSYVVFNYELEWKNLSKRIYAQKEVNRKGNKVNKKLKRPEQIALVGNRLKTARVRVFSRKRPLQRAPSIPPFAGMLGHKRWWDE